MNRPDSVPNDALEDELLAVRCQIGERPAFDALIERWHEPLWKYARRFADSDDACADIVQDIWLRVVRAIAALRDPARLRPWLFGIARRVVMDRLRAKYAMPAVADEPADVAVDTDTSDLDEMVALLREEIAWLPIVEREALVLFYLRELSLGQMAEVLAVPVGTVKSRLFRARQMMRKRLSERGVQP